MFEGHDRRGPGGKRFVPRLLALPQTEIADWLRDDLPDLLWPASLWERGAYGEGSTIGNCFTIASEVLDPDGPPFDGRLTSLEAIPDDARPELLSRIEAEIGLEAAIPRTLRQGLSLFEDYPGRWFVTAGGGVDGGEEDVLNALAVILAAPALDESGEAWVKFAPLLWAVLRGNPMDHLTVEMLRDYPTVPEKRPAAESIIRASFGARLGAESHGRPERRESQVAWAQRFWRRTGSTSACMPVDEASPSERTWDDVTKNQEIGFGYFKGLWEDFCEIAFAPNALDAYRPAKWEVGVGLVGAAMRRAAVMIGSPFTWNGEHGAQVIRSVVEARIVWTWMQHQDGDTVYDEYKKYGKGKQKLLLAHLEPLVEQLGDSAPTGIVDAAERLREKLGGEWGLEFTEVSVEATFSGRSLRSMAIDAGLKDAYTYTFQPMSGPVHAEWGSLTEYVMTRCANPLHRWHMTLVPSLESNDDLHILEVLLLELEALVESLRVGLAGAEDVD